MTALKQPKEVEVPMSFIYFYVTMNLGDIVGPRVGGFHYKKAQSSDKHCKQDLHFSLAWVM
jgi:hypothetical protein